MLLTMLIKFLQKLFAKDKIQTDCDVIFDQQNTFFTVMASGVSTGENCKQRLLVKNLPKLIACLMFWHLYA